MQVIEKLTRMLKKGIGTLIYSRRDIKLCRIDQKLSQKHELVLSGPHSEEIMGKSVFIIMNHSAYELL